MSDFYGYMRIIFGIIIGCIGIVACENKSAPHVHLDVAPKKDSLSAEKRFEIPYLSDSSYVFECDSPHIGNLNDIWFSTQEDTSWMITTFRGNAMRNQPHRGRIQGRPNQLSLHWTFETERDPMRGQFGSWGGGAGWTGQPLLCTWTQAEMKMAPAIFESFKQQEELHEVIQASLCGAVYFIELETGKPTRNPVYVHNPIKGTPSFDAENKQFLFVGQGIPHRGHFAWRVFDFRTNELLHEELLPPRYAYRDWGACDASPLLDSKSNSFIWPTESGVIFRGRLDRSAWYQAEQYRYKLSSSGMQGIESSPSAAGYLGFFTDNIGNLQCIDLRSMKPRWHVGETDDSDATPVIAMENNRPYVYVGNEVDKQGHEGRGALKKYDGLTGQLAWSHEHICISRDGLMPNNGGTLSSVLIGRHQCAGRIYTLFSLLKDGRGGLFVCLDASTGKSLFEIPLHRWSWMSPIAVYDQAGNGYIYFTDVSGMVYLIDGLTGEIIYQEDTGITFEASPIAVGNYIIHAGRGNKVLCWKIS